MPRLRRTHPGQPGFTRRRRGRGWSYYDEADALITDTRVRARLEDLAIPPAWQDVWVTPFANGHLQAVGTDVKGRRQYLYHPAWQDGRDRVKHRRVLQFGAALPRARTVAMQQLAQSGWGHERALAVAFRLLDLGHFRIGGAAYAQANGSYGLSTLLRSHVHRHNDVLIFEYTAKSGLTRVERIDDELLVDAVGALARRRAAEPQELLAYRTAGGWRPLTGEEINEYVRSVTGLTVSAKDFRTWHGTVLGSVALALEHLAQPRGKDWSERARDRAVRRAVVAVAENLGNTPAVCRGSYINPRTIDLFREGVTIERTITAMTGAGSGTTRSPDPAETAARVAELGAAPGVERAVLRMLKQ